MLLFSSRHLKILNLNNNQILFNILLKIIKKFNNQNFIKNNLKRNFKAKAFKINLFN